MTQEQKARAYDKAIEMAKTYLNTTDSVTDAELVELIFPELKESEDERIRKKICKLLWDNAPYEEAQEYINYICRKPSIYNSKEYEKMKETCIFYLNKQKCYVNDVSCIEKCIAWLEKQNSNVDNANKEYWRGYREGKQEILDKYAELEKSQQKFVDNVKPKFKVGNWIIYNRNDSSREILYIYDIRDGRYYFNDNIHFSWSVKECDEKCHLWTIKNARAGDVLACNQEILLFKSYLVQGRISLYCW